MRSCQGPKRYQTEDSFLVLIPPLGFLLICAGNSDKDDPLNHYTAVQLAAINQVDLNVIVVVVVVDQPRAQVVIPGRAMDHRGPGTWTAG